MGTNCCRSFSVFLVLTTILLVCGSQSALAQGFGASPFRAPNTTGLDLAPSNPLGLPGSSTGFSGRSGPIHLSDKLFRDFIDPIPNLEVGYLFDTGEDVDSGRLTVDYLLPIRIGQGAVFGEAHGEFRDFWKIMTRGAKNRIDLSFGGGYRTIVSGHTLIGVNGFYDTTRLGNRWYSSGSVGVEMEAVLPGYDTLDLSFNWYGNLLNRNVLANAFRRGPSNFDFQAGFSHELWNGGPDLRIFATGYRFSSGNGVYGSRAGAELRSRDGMFTIKYAASHDRIHDTYHTIGGFVNVGFRLSNIMNGESPLTAPEPVFRSPRNLRRLLTRPVRRTTGQPASIVISRAATGGASFTRTVVWGTIPTGLAFTTELFSSPIPAADLAGVSRVVITWTGPAAPPGGTVLALDNFPFCSGSQHSLGGATSPPGSEVTNSAFWNPVCGDWTGLQMVSFFAVPQDFGVMTLEFFQ